MNNNLNELRQNWSMARADYPGWIICPHNNRQILWHYTEKWIGLIFEAVADEVQLSSVDSFLLLYELNWRLEATLTPLFSDWAETIEAVLRRFNPFPSLMNLEESVFRPDAIEHQTLITSDNQNVKWVEVQEKWVELAFAVMREARDSQDGQRFTIWKNYLQVVIEKNKQWRSRWFYEQCLFHLYQFNTEITTSLCQDWATVEGSDFWEIRRASIIAELGDLEQAKRVAETTLAKIRSRIRPYSIDYSLMSQEGWAMLLLEVIQLNSWNSREETQNRDRLEQLRIYRCDPRDELERAAVNSSKPLPIPKPNKEVRPSFNPGKVTVSRHLTEGKGLTLNDIRPAFAFIRMFEEGGFQPIKHGVVTTSYNNEISSAVRWISPHAPLWGLGVLIRSGQTQRIEELFDRVFVATLQQEYVDALSSNLLNALSQKISDFLANQNHHNQERFKILGEVLSRLCFRCSIETCHQILDLLIKLDQSKTSLYRVKEVIKHLFERVFDNLPQERIIEKLPNFLLFNLSLENDADHLFREIIDPFFYVDWEEDTNLSGDFDRSKWELPIRLLIEMVASGSPVTRGHAVFRLSKICQINGLSSDEMNRLAIALWRKNDPETKLPSELHLSNNSELLKSVFLGLPETETGQVRDLFRQYLFSQDFPFPIERTLNGGWSVSLKSEVYINDWLNSTAPLLGGVEQWKEEFFNWTTDNVKLLLKKIIKTLEKEYEILKQSSLRSDFLVDFDKYFILVKKIIRNIIFPHLLEANEEVESLTSNILSILEEFQISIISLLPGTLLISLYTEEEISQKLRLGLNSNNIDDVQESIEGVYYWFVLNTLNANLPTPPKDLLNELINRVLIRRQPGLIDLIWLLTSILKRMPHVFDQVQIDTVCIAVQYLIEETKLPKPSERDRVDAENPIIPVIERPSYRKVSAELAYQLYQVYLGQSQSIPSILDAWQEVCQTDPLPEVRRVWK
jgi:hypothetical protein